MKFNKETKYFEQLTGEYTGDHKIGLWMSIIEDVIEKNRGKSKAYIKKLVAKKLVPLLKDEAKLFNSIDYLPIRKLNIRKIEFSKFADELVKMNKRDINDVLRRYSR